MYIHVSSSYSLESEKDKILPQILICMEMLSFIQFSLLLLLGIVYSRVHSSAASRRQQMESKRNFP